MQTVDNANATDNDRAVQFYWGSSDYKQFVKGDGVLAGNSKSITYTWSADDSNVTDWNPNKTLVIKNSYPALLADGQPSSIALYPVINGMTGTPVSITNVVSENGIVAEKTGTGSRDGVGSFAYSVVFVKSDTNLSMILSIDDNGLGTITSLGMQIAVIYNNSSTVEDPKVIHKSATTVTVGDSINGSGSDEYVLGESHSLTIIAQGILPEKINLVDMGNQMETISGHELGDVFDNPDFSTVTSSDRTKVISSGSSVPSGTFVGIWAERPFMEESKAGIITITCGQTVVSYYMVSTQPGSIKQCMFRMPDGDTTVSVVYDTVHVAAYGDNGSVVAKRNIDNVWYQDEYFFEGETVALTATADNGYLFDSFEVKSGEVSITNGTFVVGDSDIVIEANFVEKEYNISITQATGGTVTPSKLKAKAGETITLSVTTSKGYSLTSLSSQQIPSMTKDTRSFDMPASDVSITVEYEQMAQLSCTATQSSGMTILDVTVAANIGAGMEDPVFLIAGTYDGDIVVNAYSHIKTGTDHIERVSFSSYGLQEIFVQLVEGISSDPTGYFCVYTVGAGA